MFQKQYYISNEHLSFASEVQILFLGQLGAFNTL
jgi:hypothetical protein